MTDAGEPPEPPRAPLESPLPPPARRSGGADYAKFTVGFFLTIILGFYVGVAVYGTEGKRSGCAIIQLIYVIPAVIVLLRVRQRAWALGVVFGGAVVILLASICG